MGGFLFTIAFSRTLMIRVVRWQADGELIIQGSGWKHLINHQEKMRLFVMHQEVPSMIRKTLLLLFSCKIMCSLLDAPLGSSVHGITQARIPEWVAISFSRGSSRPRVEFSFPVSLALAGRFFTTEPMWKQCHRQNSVWKILKNKWSGFLKIF